MTQITKVPCERLTLGIKIAGMDLVMSLANQFFPLPGFCSWFRLVVPLRPEAPGVEIFLLLDISFQTIKRGCQLFFILSLFPLSVSPPTMYVTPSSLGSAPFPSLCPRVSAGQAEWAPRSYGWVTAVYPGLEK